MAHEQHPNPNPHDDPSTVGVIVVGLVGVLIFVAFVIAIVAMYDGTKDDIAAQTELAGPSKLLAQLNAAQEQAISQPRVIDAEKGVYGISIDRAIKLVAEDLAGQAESTSPAKRAADARSSAERTESP